MAKSIYQRGKVNSYYFPWVEIILQLHLEIYIKYDKSYDLGDEILFVDFFFK